MGRDGSAHDGSRPELTTGGAVGAGFGAAVVVIVRGIGTDVVLVPLTITALVVGC
jgi:hypothetical protein